MRILFTGGGTLGSVTPLLALYEYLHDHSTSGALHAAWIGTGNGPEWNVIRNYNIKRITIFTGKFRRYLSFRNLIDPFFLFFGFLQAIYHIFRFRPTVVINAGSYVGVGVIWAAWFVGTPVVLLQLDIQPSLANIFTLLHAKKICASCDDAAKKFPKNKTVITGIPVRKSVSEMANRSLLPGERQRMKAQFGIYDTAPVVLISGGGTGAGFLNVLTPELAQEETNTFHILHITGKGKEVVVSENKMYHQFSFVDDFASIAACADIVVSRAGMGTISELAVLEKPVILIPIPASHQVENALYCQRNGAAMYLAQEHTTEDSLRKILEKLLADEDRKAEFARNIQALFPKNAAARIAEIL